LRLPRKYGRSVTGVQSTQLKKMHGQVTLLDRPLPPEIVSKRSGTQHASRGQRAVHPTKKMHGQVTSLDRPLPPGEGWGEGLVKSTSSLSTSLIVVSVERIEGVLLSDEPSAHSNHVREVLPRSIRVAER
jgi:hypothetical protein